MPAVRIAKVIRCSSEDPVFCAQNLLLTERYRKFVCHSSNQTNRIQIDLQLATPSQITSIDLGNHCSAFVSVLVGHSCDDGKELSALLPETMLQTPVDARAGRHKTSVRFFRPESLSPASRDQFWDVVRVVLRQPYKTRDQFGLAFLKLQGKEQSGDVASAAELESAARSSPRADSVGGLVKAGRSPTVAASSARSLPGMAARSGSAAPPSADAAQQQTTKMATTAALSSMRPALPGASSHQLATSAGGTMAKAPQRLMMSRVRRMDVDVVVAADGKRRFCDSDGVTLRSDIVRAEMQAKSKTPSVSSASIVTPALDQLRCVISCEKARQKDAEAKVWDHFAANASPDRSSGIIGLAGDVDRTAVPGLTGKRKHSPSAQSPSPSARRVMSTPSCSTVLSPRIGSLQGSRGGDDFIEFEPTTPRRNPSTTPSKRPSSMLDRIDAELQNLDSSRLPTLPSDNGDGMMPRRSFLDPRNKESASKCASSVNFMSSYGKQKPKLADGVSPTVLGLGGADEEVDDNGVPIEQRVGNDGRVTYKKVERRPIPKPSVTLKTRFKPNKQMKIGPLLDRMKASGVVGDSANVAGGGWLQAHNGSGQPLPNTDIVILDDDDDPAASAPNGGLGSPRFRPGDQLPPACQTALEAEIQRFLGSIDLASLDIETVTFRDMRQQFEFSRGRELERSQYRTFLNLAKIEVEQVIPPDDVELVPASSSKNPEKAVECPLCQKMFPVYAVEVHAASCFS